MGIDKLRLITTEPVSQNFCGSVNWDVELYKDCRRMRLFDVFIRNPEKNQIDPDLQCRIATRKGKSYPAFFLHLNFQAFTGHGLRQILEVNPNKFIHGADDLRALIRSIFGEPLPDFKVSRIDLNADVQMPVDRFFRSLRVPYKRKATKYSEERRNAVRVHGNCGVTGFQLGASPSLLRVYDKREELRRLRQETDHLPAVLTRFEWELRHSKCPIKYLSELPELLEIQPFDQLQFTEPSPGYDFRADPVASRKRYLYDSLAEDYGAHEAARILNRSRHFKRDVAPLLMPAAGVKEQLHRSYLAGVARFLDGQCADIGVNYEQEVGTNNAKTVDG